MKRMLAMLWIALAVPFTASASEASKAYTQALRDAVVPCHTMRYKANLDEQLQRDRARINARLAEGTASPDNSGANDQIRRCLEDAKAKAADAYKAFSAEVKSPDVKQAGKSLLVAYFAYLKVTTDGMEDEHTEESVAWRKAESSLDVEASISE